MTGPVSSFWEIIQLSNIMSGIAGLFGGVSIAVFWQPRPIKEKGKFVGGAIIGAISFGFPFIFGKAVLSLLGVDVDNASYKLAIDTILGAVGVGCFSFVANWLKKREDKDIGEIIKDVKESL